MQALACNQEMSLEPLPCHGFFGDLFAVLRSRIDGDLVFPSFPFRYVSANEEATVAVVSLFYAALRRRVTQLEVRTENTHESFSVYLSGVPYSGAHPFEGEEKSMLPLLRAVAKNGGMTLSFVSDENIDLRLTFARYVAEVQEVRAVDEERSRRIAVCFSRWAPLFSRDIL